MKNYLENRDDNVVKFRPSLAPIDDPLEELMQEFADATDERNLHSPPGDDDEWIFRYSQNADGQAALLQELNRRIGYYLDELEMAFDR